MTGNSIISQPDVTINIVPAQQAVGNTAHKTLIVAQKTAAGSAVSGALQEQVGNDSSIWDSVFGPTSMARSMINGFKKINKESRLDVIALSDNGSGVKAAGAVVFTGGATAAGSLTVTIGSDQDHKYTVAIANLDTPTTIGAALVAAITADTHAIVTAVNTTGSVAITAVNAGTEGNGITIKVEGSVAGVTVAVTAMTGGLTNPVLTGIFDVIGSNRYQTIVWPYSYGLTEVKALLDGRFNVNNAVLDGVCITTTADTYANLVTAGTGQNSQSLTIIGFKSINDSLFKGSSMLEWNPVISSVFAGIRALRLTQDANISNYVISTGGALDSFGGPALASFPYFNTPFSVLPLIPTGKGFDNTEIETLTNTYGITMIGNNTAGNETIAGEVVTTYKNDSAGNPDISFKYLNYVDTASNAREYFFNNLKARFAQSRLTTGDVIEGRSMANEGVIRAFMLGLYDDLSGVDFVLLQAGETARKYFNSNMTIAIDLANGKVTIQMKVPLVTQLRTIVATMQIAFSVEG